MIMTVHSHHRSDPGQVTDANSGCITDRTPSLRELSALLGSHRRSELTDVGLVLGNLVPDRLHGEHTSLSIAAYECPSTTAAHPSAVIGRSEAARLLLDLFEDVGDYLLEHVGHRGREHRPVRGDDRLRCDLFLVAADRTLFGDNLTVRCILTDGIGAMVSTTEERFVGRPNHRGTATGAHEKPEQPHR